MKRPVYKLLSLMAMASLLLLTMAPVMAQTHTVYAGQTSELGVQELPGHTYEWDLFTDDVSINFAVTPGNCPAVNAYFNGPSTGPTVSVTWLIPGVYYYRVIATDPKGCSNLRMGMMTVLNAAPVAIIEDMSPICEGDQTTLTINLTGTSPWSLDLDDGSAIITYSNILASPFILNISPLTTTYFTVTSLTDANTTNANPSNTVELIVNPLPAGSRIYHYDPVSLIVSNDIPYVIDSVCTGSERNYRIDGEPGSTYSWALTDPGGNTTLLAGSNDHISIQWNLAPGDYTLTAIQTGTLGCSSTETGIIRVFEPPAALAGNNAVLCNSDPYTLTEATASNYSTLSWSSSGDGTFDNAAALHPIYTFGTGDLAAGNITLTLTVQGLGRDETCTAATSSLELIITNLAATASSVPASCSAASDGSVTITASDGTEPYSFTLEGNTQPTGEFTGLAPGSYNYSVADATGCTLSGEVTVGALDPITAELLQTNVDCFGASNGEITVANASGGSGLFEFSIDLINWQPETSFTGLAAGNYTISARDANAPLCLYELGTITLTEPEILAATLNFTNETFAGANNGTITVSAPTGGSGSYEYSIDGITWQASGNFTALAPGTYDVLIRDANAISCSMNLGQVVILSGGSLTATVAFTNVTCFGAADGSITITDPQNGSGSYEYSIDGGVNWQTSGLFTGLTPDAYAVMMRDANEVTNVANLGTVTISEPAVLTALVDKTDITCHQTTGSVTVTASGGSGIYEYRLEPGTGWQSANVFNALSSGIYNISIRDSKACEILIEGITIETISGPEIVNIEITHATNGLDDGSANIVANGVAQPLGYSLTGNGTDWQPASLFNNLSTGHYTAFVQDANGCTTSMAFDILNSVSGEVEITADTVTYCLNLPVIIPVEARDFTDISSFIMELAYNTEVLSFTGLTGVNPALENGTFSNSIVGDTLQIRFSTWDNVTTVGTGEQLFSLRFDALAPGNSDLIWNWMQCVLYSADNDSIPAIFVNGLAEILPSPAIYSEGSGTYCEGDMLTLRAGSLDDQQISFEWTGPSGFTHPEADWQLGQLGINDNGQFRLIATNPENCRATQDVEVRVNPKPQISLGYADTLCFGQQELLNPGSGYASYLWHDGSTAESRIAIEAGTYWVQVTDVNNCKASDSIHVVPCNLELLIPNAFTPNGDGLNDTFRPLFSGFEFNDFYMAIYTKWGDLVFTTTDFITGWDGTINGNPAQTDTYIYVISYEAPSYVTRTLPSPATGDITLIR